MTNVIYLGGVRGVGKTTITREIKILNPEIGTINGREETRLLSKAIFNKSFDELDAAQMRLARLKMLEKARSSPYRLVIVDGHYVSTNEGKCKVLLDEEMGMFVYNYVLIEADAHQILLRREKEPSARSLNIDFIVREIKAEHQRAFYMSQKGKKSLTVIWNSLLESAVTDLSKLLRCI